MLQQLKSNPAAGSPPQVRGKPDTPAEETETDRITPAGAGKTNRAYQQAQQMGDHPRRCGENYIINFQFFGNIGSPPQVRGKPLHTLPAAQCIWITPAGAGKTD